MPRVSMIEFLIQKNFLTREQAEEAMKVSKQTSQPLERAIIQLGYCGEREVLSAKAQESGIPFADLDNLTIDSSALNVVPERIVKNHGAIPIRKDGQQLWIAIRDTNNLAAIDDFRIASGCRVIPVLAVQGAIEDAIRRNYGGGTVNQAAADPTPAKAAAPTGGANFAQIMAEASVKQGRDAEMLDDGREDDAAGADAAPIIRLASAIIQQAITDRASDIHVEPGAKAIRVRYRIDGVLMETMTVPRNLMAPLISRYKIMADMNIAERRIPQDGRIEVKHHDKEIDLRVSSIPTPFGEKIVMRILDKTSVMIGLEKIGFLEANQIKIEELVSQPNGMFLCTGPTGSGKTTTQYSVLNKLNTVGVNIITAEDPIEYQLNGIAQVQMNRKAGLTFATALRAYLRQDPDIIMVGEMRDLETAEIAIEASLTGHLVLSTLHTNDAPSATLRMIDMGVEPYLIAATVIGVLAQRLGRRIDSENKESYEVPQIDLRRFGFNVTDPDAPVVLFRGVPAEYNRMTGYRGRTGFHELMTMNAEIAELVVRRAPLNDIKEAAKANGMLELRQDGLAKVLMGITTPEEVMRVVFTAGY
ncbi:MAG TPA: ATPase, T2SS/T4P/T4SS family [Fimbriimonas sp.]|nr:ATPase, T2SS/T4P/T4SS family [Fimbriimonas sp.]